MSTGALDGGMAEGGLRGRWGVPRGGYAANRLMLWVGSNVLWAGYVAVWFAALYFFLFVPKARHGSLKYLERVQAGARRGVLRRGWESYWHMVEFGYLLLDRAVMLMGPAATGGRGFEMTCDGLLHLREAMDQGRGVIMLTGHFGNAEVAAPYMRRMGLTRPIHIVMYQDMQDATEKFHTKFRKMLADVEVITTTDPLAAGVKIIRALRAGDVVAIRADRTVGGRAVEVEMLGARVGLPAGPFVAAALSGAPVVSVYTCRRGYRKYACVISESHNYGDETPGTRDERMDRAAGDYARFLEGILRKYPYQWSNFYDFWGVQGGS